MASSKYHPHPSLDTAPNFGRNDTLCYFVAAYLEGIHATSKLIAEARGVTPATVCLQAQDLLSDGYLWQETKSRRLYSPTAKGLRAAVEMGMR